MALWPVSACVEATNGTLARALSELSHTAVLGSPSETEWVQNSEKTQYCYHTDSHFKLGISSLSFARSEKGVFPCWYHQKQPTQRHDMVYVTVQFKYNCGNWTIFKFSVKWANCINISPEEILYFSIVLFGCNIKKIKIKIQIILDKHHHRSWNENNIKALG